MTHHDPNITYALAEQQLDELRLWMKGKKATPSVRLIYRMAEHFFHQCIKKDAEIAKLRGMLGINERPKHVEKLLRRQP